MKRFLSCLALAAAFCMPTIVRADTFLNFELDGYAHDDPKYNLPVRHITGLFTIDTTTGTFVNGALDSYLTEPYIFSARQFSETGFLENELGFSNTVNALGFSTEPRGDVFNMVLALNLPVLSLVGYQGGPICSEANFADCMQVGSSFQPASLIVLDFASGSLTPAPEPSSLILLGTGLVGLLGASVGRRLKG